MLNGRGYPDTVMPGPLPRRPAPVIPEQQLAHPDGVESQPVELADHGNCRRAHPAAHLQSQRHQLLHLDHAGSADAGGGRRRAHPARVRTASDLYYDTTSVTLGGGEAVDVIIDTAGIPTGTYFLYTTNLNYLSNNTQDYGGMMTEIRIL